MSVLGNIAHRLQTDLAETARAAVDINFSKKLTEDRMNERSFTRKALEERKAQERRFAFEAQQAKIQREWAAATSFGTKLFDTALESGDVKAWGAFANYASNPNLPPELASYFKNMNSAQGTRTLEQMKHDHSVMMDYEKLGMEERKLLHTIFIDKENLGLAYDEFEEGVRQFDINAGIEEDKLSLDQKKFLENIRQFNSEEFRLYKQFYLDERKQTYKEMQDIKQEGINNGMKYKLHAFIDTTKGLSDAEKQAFHDRITGVDMNEHTLDQVWDELMERHRLATEEAGKTERAKISAGSSTKDPLPVAPNKEQIIAAGDYMANSPEYNGLYDQTQKDAMSAFVAQYQLVLARKASKDPNATDEQKQPVYWARQAFDVAKSGILEDNDSFTTSEKFFDARAAAGDPPAMLKVGGNEVVVTDAVVQSYMKNRNISKTEAIKEMWQQFVSDYEIDY